MTGRERIREAMAHGQPDRVPVMCQLSIGHYLINTGIPPSELWFSSEAFARALIMLADAYGFDGILINLPGQPENWREHVGSIEPRPDGSEDVFWPNGEVTHFPADDNPQHDRRGKRRSPTLEEVDPGVLFYDDPHVACGLKYPYGFGPDVTGAPPRKGEWPPYWFRTIDIVREEVGDRLSVHSEVFSPFTQFLEMFGYQNALMYLLDDPGKCELILQAYAEGTADLAVRQAERGVDAVLISSAFAGAGFISRGQYEQFVLPYERYVIQKAKEGGAPVVYTHTCGAIGDRLDLMVATGLDGIDTLDPPPLGTVDLAEAKAAWGDKIFFKGNIDSVNTLLNGTLDDVMADARERVKVGMPGGGYILSSACSVAPRVEPEKLMALAVVAQAYGSYPQ